MDLLSLPYAVFVVVAALLFHLIPGKFRATFLVIVSLIFYGYYSPVSALIVLVSSVIVFAAARMLDAQEDSGKRRTVVFGGASAALLGYLTLIKFLPLLHAQGRVLGTGGVLIALGVSYYTFKLLGYLIDVYWGKYPAWTSPIQFAAYATFFPQLPAGPIQRANEFSLPVDGSETAELMTQGMKRIFWGAVKKTVVADQLASVIAYIDGAQPALSNMLWIAACLYALEMYFDFAALTDIAVGTAALFGIRSPENFDYPFFAPSISQFWRRWHMTLTFWLTDYVFTPLRMSTRNLGALGLMLSITINMTLIGLWHGIGMGFLLFGLVHSVYLIVDSLSASWRRKFYRKHPAADRFMDVMGPVFVFAMVAFALVFFRAESTASIAYQMHHLWDGLGSPIASLQKLYYNYSRMLFGITCLVTVGGVGIELNEYLRRKGGGPAFLLPAFPAFPVPLRWLIYYVGVAVVVTLHQQNVHFIYVQF
ncbi:MAG TPA: MBOAT family O-acyltransferase [Terracidiphilus sp.]|nr:MBOAT family O-acyltransferase [Terracidiphilus sp.]